MATQGNDISIQLRIAIAVFRKLKDYVLNIPETYEEVMVVHLS